MQEGKEIHSQRRFVGLLVSIFQILIKFHKVLYFSIVFVNSFCFSSFKLRNIFFLFLTFPHVQFILEVVILIISTYFSKCGIILAFATLQNETIYAVLLTFIFKLYTQIK